eukprot:10032967-Lingulodinium_polyedra.AAC.1
MERILSITLYIKLPRQGIAGAHDPPTLLHSCMLEQPRWGAYTRASNSAKENRTSSGTAEYAALPH